MIEKMSAGGRFICYCVAAVAVCTLFSGIVAFSKHEDPDEIPECQQAAEYIQKSSEFTLTIKRVGKGYKDWKYTVYINENSVVETTSTKSECDAIKQMYPSIVLFNNSKEEVEDGE